MRRAAPRGCGQEGGPGSLADTAAPFGLCAAHVLPRCAALLLCPGACLCGPTPTTRYVSRDAGVTFTQLTDDGDLPPCPKDKSSCAARALACSADAASVAVAVNGGFLFEGVIDEEGGMAWAPVPGAPEDSWMAAALNGAGDALVAGSNAPGFVYQCNLSPAGSCGPVDDPSHWSGSTSAAKQQWNDVASSRDGNSLVTAPWYGTGDAACQGGGSHLYHSSDGGETWTPGTCLTRSIIASSADGKVLVYAEGLGSDGTVRVSTDAGATWSGTTPELVEPGTTGWSAVAVSGDGATVLVGDTYAIYRSLDAGATWTNHAYGENGQFFSSIAISDDGRNIVAASALYDEPTMLFQSSDGGDTWFQGAASPPDSPSVTDSPPPPSEQPSTDSPPPPPPSEQPSTDSPPPPPPSEQPSTDSPPSPPPSEQPSGAFSPPPPEEGGGKSHGLAIVHFALAFAGAGAAAAMAVAVHRHRTGSKHAKANAFRNSANAAFAVNALEGGAQDYQSSQANPLAGAPGGGASSYGATAI